MTEDFKTLYRELGYAGPLDESIPRGPQPNELPPLDQPGLGRLEERMREQPEVFFDSFRQHYQYPFTDEKIRDILAELRKAFDHPAAYVKKLRSKRATRMRGKKEFPVQLILYPDIDVDPANHQFEPLGDALGWVVNSGYYFIRDPLGITYPKAKFRWHHEFPSRFKYEMKDRQGRPVAPEQKLSIALFGDFGTGAYHSLYIAGNIAARRPDYAIHLGDVYYSGRFFEFENFFSKPLAPVIKDSHFFALNANHEMLSGAIPYFDAIDERRQPKPGWVAQEQEGSYCCIWSKKYQIIGIDTAYEGDGRHSRPEVNAWLRECLEAGKSASPPRINILLSQNEPYGLGENQFSQLYNDLNEIIQKNLIDFWFWGNVHYCALFDKSSRAPFIGSCIGHAGHPIYKKYVEKNERMHRQQVRRGSEIPAASWVDLSPKFPADTGLRKDLANHGFCVLELERDAMKLIYYDWLKNEAQHERTFAI